MDLPIASPPWTKLGKKLESLCRKAIFQFQLLEDSKLLVALSGGKDSLTLLYLLKAISGRGLPPIDIAAVHVEGSFSCGASLSTRLLIPICQALDIPLFIRSSQEEKELSCYSCSRERRRLIFQTARELGYRLVAFAHHREDSIETLLMNLFHKAEFSSIHPKVTMHAFGVTIIRPLIYISEEQIVAFARSYSFERIVCKCPVGQNSYRKKVKSLIENIERDFPNIRGNLAQASFVFGSKKSL